MNRSSPRTPRSRRAGSRGRSSPTWWSYHPDKRQDGLRDGNLKELFEEEIRKSWEEYADQVGKDVADSTPYFKEALNEILAGGRQIF